MVSFITRRGYGSRTPIARRQAARTIARYVGNYVYNNRHGLAAYSGTRLRQAAQRVQRIFRNRNFPTRRTDVRGALGGNDIRSSYRPYVQLTSTKRRSNKKAKGTGLARYRKHQRQLMHTMYKNLCTPQVIKWTYANTFSGVQGQRQYISVFLGGESLLQYFGTKRPSNFLFDSSPAVGSGAGTYQDIGQKNWKIHVDRVIYDMRIQNRSNASMELKIYECVARRDFSLAVDSTSLRSVIQSGLSTPGAVGSSGNVGPNQDALTTGVTQLWQLPSSSPYDSNEFTSAFKILRQTSLKVGPNEIVPLKQKLTPREFKASWIYSPESKEYQKGWSKIVLFSWVGQPVDDGTTAKNTKAVTDLSIQFDANAKFHFLPGQEKLVNIVLNTPGSTSGGTAQYGPQFYGYANTEVAGMDNQYYANPGGFTPVVPATETIQTVSGTASTGDTVPNNHP